MRTPSKLSPGLIAVLLVTREHSRLSGQIKSLDKLLQAPYSDKEYQRLQTMSANWRALLAHDGAAKLADAVDAFIAGNQQRSSDLQSLYEEVVFQGGIYRMEQWHVVKHFIPEVSSCLVIFNPLARRRATDHGGTSRSGNALCDMPRMGLARAILMMADRLFQ